MRGVANYHSSSIACKIKNRKCKLRLNHPLPFARYRAKEEELYHNDKTKLAKFKKLSNAERAMYRRKNYRSLRAFDAWGVTLIFNIMFIVMHTFNYPEAEATALYLFLVFGINLPWTLSCVRAWILVRRHPNPTLTLYDYHHHHHHHHHYHHHHHQQQQQHHYRRYRT